MRRTACTSLLLSVYCLLALGSVAAAGKDPASVVPRDAVVYGEVSAELLQEGIAIAAAPPVAKVFAPGLQSPFGHYDTVLSLPPGTVEQAVRHVQGVGFGATVSGPFLVISFDDARWPRSLLQGGTPMPNGTVTFGDTGVGAAVRDTFLFVGSTATCREFALGDYAALATDPNFAEARRRAKDAPVWSYLNVPELLRTVRKTMLESDAEELDTITAALGLDRIGHCLQTLRWGENGGRLELSVGFEGEGAPVLNLLPDTSLDVARFVPEGAAAAVMVNWADATAFFGGARDLLVQIDNAIGRGEAQMSLAVAEQTLGMTLDELFAMLGPGLAVYYPGAAQGQLIARDDWTAVLLLQKPQQFEATLEAVLMNNMGQFPSEHVHQGIPMQRLLMPPVLYKVMDDRIVLGPRPEALKRYLDWASDPQSKPLVAEAPHAIMMIRLDLGLLMRSYPKTKSGTKAIIAVSRQGSEVQITAGLDDFNYGEFMREYYAVSSTMLAAALMPALGRARGEARKTMSRGNLHNIGIAIAMYRMDHGEEFPPDLQVLLEKGYLGDEIYFLDPADQAPIQRGEMGLKYSYEYVGPIPSNVPPTTVICYSRKGIHAGGRNVLYNDMAVEWVPEAQLHARAVGRGSLYESYDAVVKAFGDRLTEERKAELKKFHEIEDSALLGTQLMPSPAKARSVPNWVTKGSGAFPGDRGKAIYGVGVASPDPNLGLQRNMARFNARIELARSEKAYVAELIKSFVQKHQDYFDEEYASSVQFYQQAGKQVTEATRYGGQEIDGWLDKGGDLGPKGTRYVLMMLPLNNEFFDVAQKQFESLIRRYEAQLLKKELDGVLKELDRELQHARQDPFALTGPVFPGMAASRTGEQD